MNEFVVVGVLFGLVALRALMVGVLTFLIIRPVRACPACFAVTVEVRRRWLALTARRLEWRWCASCGWEGLARRVGAGWAPGTASSPRSLGSQGTRGRPVRPRAPPAEE